MKAKSIKPASLCILLLCCMLVCTMCKKKDTASSTLQRIIGENFYFHDTLVMKSIFTYSGTLLTGIITYDPSGTTEVSKSAFLYSGNSLTSMTSFNKAGGTWKKETLIELMGYSGDNPTEIIFSRYDDEGNETNQYKNVYSYKDALLDKMEIFNYYSGNWEPLGSTSFMYNNKGKIVQQNDTADNYGYITTYNYNADLMTESLTRYIDQGILTNEYKTTYEYLGNLVSRSVSWIWESGTWLTEDERKYEYNEPGNLVTEEYDAGTGSYISYRVDVIYGEGSGNYRQCVKVSGPEYLLPGDPTPYPVKPNVTPSGLPFGRIQARKQPIK